MFKLKCLNVVKFVDSEYSRDNLLAQGFEWVVEAPVEATGDNDVEVKPEAPKKPIKKSRKGSVK